MSVASDSASGSDRPTSSQPTSPQDGRLYEGKAKILYPTETAGVLLAHFKDDATAFNAQKRGTIVGKGAINCAISRYLFELLGQAGIPTHYLDCPAPDQMRVRSLQIVPVEVIVRNLAAGSLCRQTGLPLGQRLQPPLVEFCYKNDDLGDPLLTRDRLAAMNLAAPEVIAQIETLARQVNEQLQAFFTECDITLVDFKLEFGIDEAGQVILGDEISPDTCRLWDNSQSDPQARVLDKDRFRQDLGAVEDAYQRVLAKVQAALA